MTIKTVIMTAAMLVMVPAAFAQKTVTTKRGGTGTVDVTTKGNTATGTATATSSRGNTVSGTGTVAKTRTGTTESGAVNGPKGGTSTYNGTTTKNANGTTTVNGTATGPRGQSHNVSHTTQTAPPTGGPVSAPSPKM